MSSRQTSLDAFEDIKKDLSSLQTIVLGVAMRLRTFIDEDLFTDLAGKMTENTIRPRRGELVSKGFIRETGRRRKNKAGRSCTEWEAVGFHEEQGTLFEMPTPQWEGEE